MAEVKKPRVKSTARSAEKVDLVEMAAAPTTEAIETIAEAAAATLPQISAKPVEADALFASARRQSDAIRKAVSESVAASAQGALEVNGKIIEAFHMQSDAAIDLWRSAMSPSPLPEALKAQSHATRKAYETASAQWKDIAETTALWFTKSVEPLKSAFHAQSR